VLSAIIVDRRPVVRPVRSATAACLLAVLGVLAAVAAPATADAQDPRQGVRLGLQYRPGQRTALLVLPVTGPAGDSLGTILSRDLKYSDRFVVVPPSSAPTVTGRTLNYAQIAKLSVEGVVQATMLSNGSLRVVLHDVGKKVVVNERDFPLPASVNSPAWRMAVHGVSDAVEEWITGQRGIAQTRIAFVRDQRIWTVDSDGANAAPLTTRGLSPQWTPNGRSIVYSVLENSNGQLMVVDVGTGRQRVLTNAPGAVDGSPVVSPDGRTVVFARNVEGGTSLYEVPIEGGTPRRISVARGTNSISPSLSPDGDRVVFTSDRTGYPDVYIADIDGTNVSVLTTGSYGDRQHRAEPDWSPDGRLVAYQSLNGEVFQVMLVNVRDQSTRIVTSEGRNDSPSWAPDSRHLVVTSTRSGVPQLWVVDIETGASRQLTFGASARLASWSRRLVP
jgi:TolB protein